MDEALKFIALNAVAGNFDSCLSEKKHNYYLYEDDGKFNILPWDYNMSFGGFGGGQPPNGRGMGGMDGGGFGGPGMQNVQSQGSPEEAATAGIAIVILISSCAFIVFYKRKRL